MSKHSLLSLLLQNEPELVFASFNEHKIKEIQKILADKITVLGVSHLDFKEIKETGKTFEENAILKAKSGAVQSGLPVLADDSGLEINVLGKAPGVYSARFAQEQQNEGGGIISQSLESAFLKQNFWQLPGYQKGGEGRFSNRFINYKNAFQKLYELLVGELDLSARFVCVLAICIPLTSKNKKIISQNSILFKENANFYTETFKGTVKGRIVFPGRGNNGFGYDPIFQPNGFLQTFAEMDEDLKNQISHRSEALKLFASHAFNFLNPQEGG